MTNTKGNTSLAPNLLNVLENLLSSGKIKPGDVPESLYNDMTKRTKEKYVKEVHTYSIKQGSDGRWRTHVYDPDKKEHRKSIAKPTYEELVDALYQHYMGIEHPERVGKINTLRDLYPLWIKYKELQAASDAYPIRINADWKKYYANDPIIDIPLEELTELKLEEWVLTVIKKHHMTKTTYNNMAIILRQGLDYAVKLELIESNNFRKVKIDSRRLLLKPKKKDDCTQVFTDEEIHAFEKLAWRDFQNHGKRVYKLAPLAALFAFYVGCRVGELTGLRFEDIVGDQIHVQRMVRRDDHKVFDHTKTSAGDRYIPLTAKACRIIDAIRAYLTEIGVPCSGYIFSEYNRPLPSRIVEEYFAKYCEEINTSRKSAHAARKTYTSALIDSGMNINTVRKTVGHSDERTTYRNYVYDRNTPRRIKEQFENALDY